MHKARLLNLCPSHHHRARLRNKIFILTLPGFHITWTNEDKTSAVAKSARVVLAQAELAAIGLDLSQIASECAAACGSGGGGVGGGRVQRRRRQA